MQPIKKLLKTSLLSLALLGASATPAFAVNPAAATADVLVVRPIGFIGTAAGAGFWLVTSPFTLINGTARENYDLLVAKPANYTFKRPLGEGI